MNSRSDDRTTTSEQHSDETTTENDAIDHAREHEPALEALADSDRKTAPVARAILAFCDGDEGIAAVANDLEERQEEPGS
jgi:hypothetical protein